MEKRYSGGGNLWGGEGRKIERERRRLFVASIFGEVKKFLSDSVRRKGKVQNSRRRAEHSGTEQGRAGNDTGRRMARLMRGKPAITIQGKTKKRRTAGKKTYKKRKEERWVNQKTSTGSKRLKVDTAGCKIWVCVGRWGWFEFCRVERGSQIKLEGEAMTGCS